MSMNSASNLIVLQLLEKSHSATSHYLALQLKNSTTPLSRVQVSAALQRLKRKRIVTNDGAIWRCQVNGGGAT